MTWRTVALEVVAVIGAALLFAIAICWIAGVL